MGYIPMSFIATVASKVLMKVRVLISTMESPGLSHQ